METQVKFKRNKTIVSCCLSTATLVRLQFPLLLKTVRPWYKFFQKSKACIFCGKVLSDEEISRLEDKIGKEEATMTIKFGTS